MGIRNPEFKLEMFAMYGRRDNSRGDCSPNMKLRDHFFLAVRRTCFAWLAGWLLAPGLWAATNEHGVVATVNPLATEAAITTLKKGGNAIDAAVAAALTLGVVDGHNSGIGGGCFWVIHRANGEVVAIDGREMAPARAERDMYLRNGKADPRLSQAGALAPGVPGALAAYDYVIRNYGKLKLADLLLPAAEIAEGGFSPDSGYAQRLAGTAKDLSRFPAAKMIFLKPDGQPYQRGEILKQADLAKTYRAIAHDGIDWFYRGPFSQVTDKWMSENGGLITEQDFKAYQIKLRPTLKTTYRGYEIVGFPPPSSGGVHVAQILQILEHFDLKSMGANSPDLIHVVAEAMKLAFADRAWWLGDPDFAKVPRGLISPEYAAQLARKIRLDHVTPVPTHGEPPDAQSDIFGKHTTHFSVADREGNWVACTQTINTSFGSKVVIPGTGVVLNNQMDDFSAQPGAANAFGLLGNEANAIAPGKRPLSSMSPTIVLKEGKPVWSLGAAGGPTIISQTLLAIIYLVDFGMDPQTALAQPRFHQQWSPDELKIETKVGTAVLTELEKRGHKLNRVTTFGACQVVGVEKDGTGFTGANDPRGEGRAAVW